METIGKLQAQPHGDFNDELRHNTGAGLNHFHKVLGPIIL